MAGGLWTELARSFTGDPEGFRRAVARKLYEANRASLAQPADWNALHGWQRTKWMGRAKNITAHL
jgi:hypothetical protein